MLLLVNLGLGDISLRGGDLDIGGVAGSGEHDGGQDEGFGRVEGAGEFAGGEAGGVDGDGEGAGWDVGEGEAAVGGGDGGVEWDRGYRGLEIGVEGDARVGDGVAVGVRDEAGDGAGGGWRLRERGGGEWGGWRLCGLLRGGSCDKDYEAQGQSQRE